MPSSLFSGLSNLADKAQSAINQTPLAGHIPQIGGRSSEHEGPTANQAAAQGGSKNYTLEALQHSIRSFGQQYTSTTPVQKIITCQKGAALDFDGVSRDSKALSKELYTWGQNEDADVKDVTDRLAYINFVHGSLASDIAEKLVGARGAFKHLRDAEAALTPARNIRSGLATQIARVEHEQAKGNEARLKDLKDQLAKADAQDAEAEKEIQILKRKAVRDSEQLKWDALREYGEKLVLLSQGAKQIISALPPVPPSREKPYAGTEDTAAARAAIQHAIDTYQPGNTKLAVGANLSRTSTQSFGVSHAAELKNLPDGPFYGKSTIADSEHSPTTSTPALAPGISATKSSEQTLPLKPETLNNNIAPIPIPSGGGDVTEKTPPPADALHTISSPTVAETGIPQSGGPGPASGSLLDKHAASPTAGPRSGGLPGASAQSSTYGQFETAEQEKARLAREDREKILAAGSSNTQAPPKDEQAEEEKKRLERQYREQLLRGDTITRKPDGSDDAPPSYQD